MDATARGVIERVRPLAAAAARDEGLDLVDMEFRREPGGWILRLFIDKAGGVGLTDCQRVSEVVGTLLEVEDPIAHAYTLEVSSPGLTRALRSREDWRSSVGSLVKIVTSRPVAGSQSLMGRLKEVGENSVRLGMEDGEVEVGLDLLVRARREVEWPAGARSAGRAEGRGRGGHKAGRAKQDAGKDGQ